MSTFASRFKAGSDIARDLLDTYELAKRKKEMAKIADAQETPAYTPGQGAELDALANAKDAEGKPYYTLGNDASGKYTVAPNFQNETGAEAGPYTPSTMAAKGVSYLGKNYDAPLTQDQTTGARTQAMAGVLERGGDLEGAMRYRQQAQQGLLAGMQIDDANIARVRRGVTDAQADTRFANDQTTFARTNEEADRQIKLRQEDEQRKSVFRDVVGKFVQGKWQAVPEIYKGYNDGNTATVKEDGKGGALISLFDKDGKPAGQQAFGSELEFITGAIAKMDPALWVAKVEGQAKDAQAQKNWDKTNTRADQSLGVQQAQLRMAQDERTDRKVDVTALRTAGVAFEAARQKGDEAGMQAATLEMIKSGGTAPGGANANDPAEVKLANAYIRAGLAKNLGEGLQLATSSKDSSPDKVKADIYGKAMAANSGNAEAAKKATEEAMAFLFPSGAKPSRSAAGKVTDLPRPTTQAEFDKLPSGAIYTNSKGGRSQKP